MLERLTGKLLSRFLSKYFILSGESSSDEVPNNRKSTSSPSKTQLAVWSGFLSFQHLQLRSSIANDYFLKKGLPFDLCCGLIDRVEINIPWAQLRSMLSGSGGGTAKNKDSSSTAGADAEIVIVLDGIYCLVNTRYEFDDDKLKESRQKQRRKELDDAMAFVADGTSFNSESSSSYFKSYVKNRLLSEAFLNDIFDNMTNRIQIHIRNVHIRVEDLESDPYRPCCFGLTLESLHLSSVEDEAVIEGTKSNNKRENLTEASLEKILAQKLMQVNQLSIYCNSMDDGDNMASQNDRSHHTTTRLPSIEVLPLQTMSDQPSLLCRSMLASIPRRRPRSLSVNNEVRHTFILYPVDSTSLAVVSKPNTQNSSGYNKAVLQADTNITTFKLGLHHSTVGHLISFYARLKHHKSLIRHRFYRPTDSISSNPRQWWKYITRVIRRELRETGNVKKGGWSWVRWYDRVELRKKYISLYERWLDHGVMGDDEMFINNNGGQDINENVAIDGWFCNINPALTVEEFEELRAIENASVDEELSVSDILLFRAMVHSKRQNKQVPTTTRSSRPVEDSYRLTRFLRRVVTSEEEVDEDYKRLLAYLDKKEEENTRKRKKVEQEYEIVSNSSQLSVVLSMAACIKQGSLCLFQDRDQMPVLDISFTGIQSKFSMLENFNTIIFDASIQDCVGRNELNDAIFLRYYEGGTDNVCKKIDFSDQSDKTLLLVDLINQANTDSKLQLSPLLNFSFTRHPLGESDASVVLTFLKTKVLFNSNIDWPAQCKAVFSAPLQNKTQSTDTEFWEDISLAYMNSWQSTKRALAAKAERAMQKQRKLDINIVVQSPIVIISDGNETLSIDLGKIELETHELAGVGRFSHDFHDEVTPIKKNTATPSLHRKWRHSSNSDHSFRNKQRGYLFTPNKIGNGPSSFLSPVPLAESNRKVLDISNIFESPCDMFSVNGSVDSAPKRRIRGWSIGNSKLDVVAENQDASLANKADFEQRELLKCFYDYFTMRVEGAVITIYTSKASSSEKLLHIPEWEATIAKSTIPSDYSLCKIRVSCVADCIHMNISNETLCGLETLLTNIKQSSPANQMDTASTYFSGSHVFPKMVTAPITDDESSVDEEVFLDAISECQPDDANQWFNQNWPIDEESVTDFTCDAPSLRHRFPSISEVSGEPKIYLSAENLSKLDNTMNQSHRRLTSYSQISGDEDSFHSAVSLDNKDELVKAIQEDIKKCENDICAVKKEIKNTVETFKTKWSKDKADIKHRRYHKRKLKTKLLRLEAEFTSLNACYRDIVVANQFVIQQEEENNEEDPNFAVKQEALHRAKTLISARKARDTSVTTLSQTKALRHYSLNTLNRDKFFFSIAVSTFELHIAEIDDSSPELQCKQEIIFLLCDQLSFSIHHREIDVRLRVSIDKASAFSPDGSTFLHCGYLNHDAISRRAVKVYDEKFIRLATETRKQGKIKSGKVSKRKFKLTVGPVEVVAYSLVDSVFNLSKLQPCNSKHTVNKPKQSSSDIMTNLVVAMMGSADLSFFKALKSQDIDLQFNSLNICIKDTQSIALLTLTSINIRMIQRILPLKIGRGQLDIGLSNIQLYDLSKDDQPRELLGYQSTFDHILQGRVRIQLSQKDTTTGGWCVEETEDESIFIQSGNVNFEELCWNIHIGIRCDSTIMLTLSPDFNCILSSVKKVFTMKSLRASNSKLTPKVSTDDREPSKSYLPIRWRFDYSMVEGVIIVPGKNYRYSTFFYESDNYVRLSSSIRLCLQPDPLKTGNISIHLYSSSFVALNTSLTSQKSVNILDHFNITCNAMAAPHILKIQSSNLELGSVNSHQAWSVDSQEVNVQLQDGIDLSLSIDFSTVKINIPPSLSLFVQGMQQHMHNQHRDDAATTSIKRELCISLKLKIPVVSVTLSQLESKLLMKEIKIRFDVGLGNTSITLTSNDVGMFFTKESLLLPVLYITPIESKAGRSIQPAFFLCLKHSAKQFLVSLKSGIFYCSMIPTFIKQFQFSKKKESFNSIRNEENSELAQKLRKVQHILTLTTFHALSEAFYLVMPSQRIPSFDKNIEPTLNAVCFQWKAFDMTLSVKTSDSKHAQTFLATCSTAAQENVEMNEGGYALAHLVECNFNESVLIHFKGDINASFCLTRSEFLLRRHNISGIDMEPFGLPVIFETVKEQLIISPFSYNFVTSLVAITDSSDTIFTSLGLHLDVGDIDILWHISRSNFGITDAIQLSVTPLFKSNQSKQQINALRQDLDCLSLQTSHPIQQACHEPPSKEVKIPAKVYLLLKETMIVSSMRVSSIQVTCVPSNAKEISSSPIIKVRIAAIRFGSCVLRCPKSSEIGAHADKILDSEQSFLYITPWLDFEISAHYQNRRMVMWEPLVELWTGNMQGCLNMSNALGMETFLEERHIDDEKVKKAKGKETSRLIALLARVKSLQRNSDVKQSDERNVSFIDPQSGLDICHHIQSIATQKQLELALHPELTYAPLHSKETFLYKISQLNSNVFTSFSLSSGKIGSSVKAMPLNINITGALIENIGAVLSEKHGMNTCHISPHYICNETGMVMCWKIDCEDSQESMKEILPGEKDELHATFPSRSYICLELYRPKVRLSRFKSVARINVDLVGVKRYTLKSSEKLDESYVVVRVQLIGTAKVVSVESSTWILNASILPLQLVLKDNCGKELCSIAISPRSDRQRNNMPQNAVPLPVDVVKKVNEKRDVSLYVSTSAFNAQQGSQLVKLPLKYFLNESQIRGRLESKITIPMPMMGQNVSLNMSSIRVGSVMEYNTSLTNPEQKLIVFCTPNAFKNFLPFPVVFEIRITSSKCSRKHSMEDSWLNIGHVQSGGLIHFPLSIKEKKIEFRIKVLDGNTVFQDWSSSVCLADKVHKMRNEQLVLIDKYGTPLKISVNIEIMEGSKEDSLLCYMNANNSAHCVVSIYVPSILIDYTHQNLEFLSGNTVLRQLNNALAIPHFEGDYMGLSRIQSRTHIPELTLVGGKSTKLAIRQSMRQQDVSSWSSSISIAKSHNRIIVPRSFYPLVLTTQVTVAPAALGGKCTRVITINNKYALVNQLPVDIEVISTNEFGQVQKRKPLIVYCNQASTPLHFDDKGFIRFRPKEIGWTYSGLITVSNRTDIAARLKNKLTGKVLIVTIEIKRSGATMTIVIRRTRSMPFRIENLSTVPLQFAQVLGRTFTTWNNSTILLPYHQADYAWDEPEHSGRHITIAVADLDFGEQPKIMASLGDFYLDKLAPGEVSMSHSHFKAIIIDDGPTRVLKITDSSLPVLTTDTTSSTTVLSRLNYECSLCVDVGISIIDWNPKELVYLSLTGLTLNRHIYNQNDMMQFTIKHISADCSLWVTHYPVLLNVLTGVRSKESLRVSWYRDKTTALGKDITLLRFVSVELGQLILKVDGALASALFEMYKMSRKSLSRSKEDDSFLLDNVGVPKSSKNNVKQSSNYATERQRILSTAPHISHKPRHKYYLQQFKISPISAEISYCGGSLLPMWISPVFMFEALPIRFPSYFCSHIYGSTNEHVQGIRQHYNVLTFLFGLSLRPSFLARACIFTIKQSLSVISERMSLTLSSICNRTRLNNLKRGEISTIARNQVISSAFQNTTSVILREVKRFFSFFNMFSYEMDTDTRMRAPRLFTDDVLLEYVEGENEGRALLSRVTMGRYLLDGYISHGHLEESGDYSISSSDVSVLFILTRERLLVIKRDSVVNKFSVLSEIELHGIALIEAEEIPQGNLALQFFHINKEHDRAGLGMLSSKLLLFKNAEAGLEVLNFCENKKRSIPSRQN